MDEFFNGAVTTRENGFRPRIRENGFRPRIDVAESEQRYEVKVYLPGMKKDEISVNLENGLLTVSGERKIQNEEKQKKFHRVETSYGSFSRSFQLPENIDPESVNATYKDGILEITVDKSEENVRKQIKIA
ncbi:MAG: Hsp20/alpha crystallin family protein [Balneolaceae bacterium]